MQLSEEKLELILNYFKTQPVLKAYLFGSYVRGEADENSDVDILVELDYQQGIGFAFVRMKLKLEELLRLTVDLVSSKGISRNIMPIIEKEKRLIYAK
jgi:predicted nucleotidyltransferase